MGKQPLILANLIYGVGQTPYVNLWLENQVKSLCDPTNLPAIKEKYDAEIVLFTDEETLQAISRHPAFMQLSQIFPINVVKMQWPADADKFASRYGLLVQMFHQVLPVALEKGAWLNVGVADIVYAKHAWPRMLRRLEDGHDAVFMMPIRCAADSVSALLAKLPGAPTDLELFEMAYAHLHHLWVASHWDAPMFSKFPYSMVWNSGTGLLSHNFGITPILFKPVEEMKSVKGVIDADVPAFCKNPYWAKDWIDAPIASVEPLSNGHYPPFLQHKANIDWVVDWSKVGTMKGQQKDLDRAFYYPTEKTFNNPEIAAKAHQIVTEIKAKIEGEQSGGIKVTI